MFKATILSGVMTIAIIGNAYALSDRDKFLERMASYREDLIEQCGRFKSKEVNAECIISNAHVFCGDHGFWEMKNGKQFAVMDCVMHLLDPDHPLPWPPPHPSEK
jgi:hypothetical protein